MPTLNAFDMGDTRTTVVIVMREREGKAGGGKGFLLAENRSFTLATSNFQIIFYGQRVGDVRVQDDKINTLQARMGTGGNNMPMVAEVLAFDSYNQSVSETSQTIRKGAAGNDHIGMVMIPEEPMAFDAYNQTLSETNQTIKAHSANNENIGMVIAPTLSATNNPSRSPQSSEVTAQIDAMVQATSTVRRLTPTECERLQGFPDGWTDGQADSHRYKQMGNAVAVPVVEWIINRLTK